MIWFKSLLSYLYLIFSAVNYLICNRLGRMKRSQLMNFFYECVFKKSVFQHREGCENLKKEERSLGET